MKVIICIPAYNEEKSIGFVIRDIKEVMDKTNHKYTILLTDDGSKDNTVNIAKESGAKVISHPRNLGLAETFKTEMKEALKLNPDIIVHTDADGQYLAEDIPRLIKEVENGNDLVLGNRFKGGIEYMPWMKRIGNKAFSRAISKIVNFKIGDCQTGFRAFTSEVAKLNIISNFTYTQEQIIRAVREKFKIKEIPTKFIRREYGESRLFSHPLKYATRAWINILRIYRDYEPLKFFSYAGFMFLIPGLIIGSWLFLRWIFLGSVGRLPSTILTSLLIIIGLQIILFGFLADMNRK